MIDAIALNLHGFYAGVKRLFEVIAEGIDQTKPTGSSWHRDLLLQMTTDIPKVRPAVLSLEVRDRLERPSSHDAYSVSCSDLCCTRRTEYVA